MTGKALSQKPKQTEQGTGAEHKRKGKKGESGANVGSGRGNSGRLRNLIRQNVWGKMGGPWGGTWGVCKVPSPGWALGK